MEISQKKKSGCGLGENIWAKLGPILLKNPKETGISMGFFHILYEVYIYKEELVVTELHEWKLKAKLARDTIFKGS